MKKVLNQTLTFTVIISLLICSPGFFTSKSIAREAFKNISVLEANQMIKLQTIHILDVRTDVEYAQSHIKDAVLIPLMVLSSRLHELKDEQNILVYCYSGNRSKTACEYLASKSFKHVYNMLGGISSWIEAGYEVTK
ncbi:MAG: rhodanese-like domain-containing protein [Candidatus Scalinduaceae bacterium]